MGLNTEHQQYLQETFGKRVNFESLERKLYSHDIAAMPGLIKPLIGNTTPAAIVQPTTEQELTELVKWAARHNIKLTPRGKATSGYGGVLPRKDGVVVDFFRMKTLLRVDRENCTVTVQPGIVWEQLEKEIQKDELMLQLYPTSYPSSTVGGWLAQGGTGIGSFEAGWFQDNVVSARVVMADGKVKEFQGQELDLISDAEGITGLISEITVKVMPLEKLNIVAVAARDSVALQKFIQDTIDEHLPLWSLSFINPKMAELKNQAPLMEHNGHPVEERVLLPNTYIITLAFREKDNEAVMTRLQDMVGHGNIEPLSDEIARHEWENRFKLMIVKRLGPSLVPAEIVVPLSQLGTVMEEIQHTVEQPVVKEGVIIQKSRNGEPEVVILGFIPADQRKFSYNFVFGLSLTIMKIAEKHGGRAYATGMYFANKADKILGTERVEKLRAFKAQEDPQNIFNPGKVLRNGLLGTTMSISSVFEPLARKFGNAVLTHIGEAPPARVKDIPGDVAWYAYSCSQCGYCVDECDQFYGRGWESQSPRGKWYWLREYMEGREKWNQFMVDSIIACTTCEMCNRRCSASLPIEPSWMKLRGQLIQEEKRMTFPPFEMMAAALSAEGNIWAGYRKDRTTWFPKDLWEKHGPDHPAKTVYFAGCTASYVEHDIAIASVRLLDEAGVDFSYVGQQENCCGTPMLVAGKWDLFAETIKKNISAVKKAGADTVVASCPACDMMWRQVYPQWAEKLGIEYGITAKHYSEVIAEKIHAGEFTFPENGQEKVKVTWHDSCHIGRASGVYEPPRDVIKAIPGVEFEDMPSNREEAHCCGSVLTLIKEPDVAADIGEVKLNEAQQVGAEKILALCPCCEFQLRVSEDKKKTGVEIVDLAHFCVSHLGYDLPDPHPEVYRQWAVFDGMIKLMSPQGFADLMQTMFPELVDAMPLGMGRMMRAMGKIPGALDLMKPMFPILFPKLLPLMMPKVLPVMLERVKEKIPMPDYMEEQMPDLMPKVMDNLMPHMIGDLVPLVTQPLVDHLQGKH